MATFAFPAVSPSTSTLTLNSNTAFHPSPLSQAIQTVARDGERLRMRLQWQNLTTANRRRLMHTISRLNGQTHRLAIRDHSYSGPAGSISVSNLHPAVTAANISQAAWQNITDLDDGVRLRREQNVSNGKLNDSGSNLTVVAGTSYALKTALITYPSEQAQLNVIYLQGGNAGGDIYQSGSDANAPTSVNVKGVTAYDTALRGGPTDDAGGPFSTYDLTRLEIARCLLIDNGFNALTYSEQFDNAAWTKTRCTVTANQGTSINADVTMDYLVEDSSASNTHYALQAYTRPSVQEYWTGSVFLAGVDSNRIRLDIEDNASNGGYAIFDASAGTIVTAGTNIGTGTNTFSTIEDWGNGIYRCRVTSRLPASTAVRLICYMVDEGTTNWNFNGDGTSRIAVWGAQMQRGGQIGRYVQTTTTATTGTAQSGSEIWVKGLDKDTNGQLLPGDQVEINGQLCIVQNNLDGDESGSGILSVMPRIRNNTSDEDAVVLFQPEGRFLLAGPSTSWANRAGSFSDFSLDLIEDITS